MRKFDREMYDRKQVATEILILVMFSSLLQLFDLVYREETLLNVIKSVTRNGRSIVLTAVLALILVYLFSIVGYIFFKDDFILAVDRIPNKTLGTECILLIIIILTYYYDHNPNKKWFTICGFGVCFESSL